jgi:phosphate transport system substrate-binding protein
MEKIQIQSKIPTRLTYRSTSTGPGQRDFVGNGTHTYNTDFASGDYPMTPDNYQLLQSHNVEMIHVPVLLGAIGVFHSVPVEEGTHLNLTACIIARIYTHEIRDWNHPDIKALNPALAIPTKYDSYGNIESDQSYPITVAGRSAGSSSTNTFTSYLNKACPDVWPVDMVGSTVDFHPSTKICPSNTLAQCVAETPGTIFYIDSGTLHNT